MISAEQLSQHGISDSEYERIQNILKREPTFTELGIFSVMWSEHCSYKSSRVHLRRLPTKGKAVLQGPGENAGIIDIGDGQAVAYKIESHNHPSYIEPFQGAATGVGGILRDIFTMGARPIAAMNSLRFGTLDSTQNRHIMEGVVGGIAFYGNCFGVPTIGGEVAFAKCYAQNPLVNAFALGLFEKDKIFYGRAEGVGNPVIYVGAKTGRDGIHGATMASAGFGEDAGAKRPNVQIGDPFMEKLLLEACLEAMDKGLIVGIQDMGAAGLTSSSCEMGARAGTGVEMELDLVPQREESMTAYEIMLSESQERMLLVAEKEKEQDIFAVFHKWGLDAVTVGRVTSDGLLRIKQHGQVMAEIPNKALADEGPRYERPMQPAGPPEPTMSRIDRFSFLDGCDESVIQEFLSADRNPGSANFNHLLLLAVASPNLCSREWVWEQYDHMVQSNTMVGPGSDAAVIRIKGTQKALVMTLDGPAFRIAQQPREGARMMVAEAARNIVCSGGRPLAATNCLNFGNPEHPEVMWQFSEVVDGMSEACTAFETPITGGNVSFYNETLGGNIYPTPVLGMVGVIEDVKHVTPSFFRNAGDAIVLLEADNLSADSINLESERALQALVHQTIRDGLILSAHDVSEGGMAVALAECCYSSTQHPAVGATVKISAHEGFCKDLFGESPSRIIVSTQNSKELISRAKLAGLRSWELGKTGGNRLTIHLDGRPDAESAVVDLAVGEVESAWRRTFPKLLS